MSKRRHHTTDLSVLMGDLNQNGTLESNSAVLLVYQRKRNRREISMAPNWSEDLPEELLISVAKWMTDSLQDFIFFGAVCKSWRSAAIEVKGNPNNNLALRLLTHQVPLFLLPLSLLQPQLLTIKVVLTNPVPKFIRQRHHRDDSLEGFTEAVEFYSLMQKGNKIGYKPNLPKILPKTRMRMCFSSFGWLVIVSETEGYKWSLVHPLNQAKIDLPDVRGFFKNRKDVSWLGKFVLSSSPSWTSDYIVMFHSMNILGFCRPGLGENKWRRINLSQREMVPRDLIYYKEQFYFVYHCCSVSVFDIDKEEVRLVTPVFPNQQLLGPNVFIKEEYLVESAGVLLVVLFTTTKIKDREERGLGLSYGCRVFEVPFTNSKSWSDSEVRSLGNRTIFLSKCSSSFSIEASDYSSGLCKPNCIYFMNDKGVYPRQCRDGGFFIMKDGTFTRNSQKEATQLFPRQCIEGDVFKYFPRQCIDGGVFSMEDRTFTREFDKFFQYEDTRGFHSWIQPSL